MTISGVVLAALCIAAAWFDLRERRIPNLLTLGGFGAALLLRAPGGPAEVGLGLAGGALGFVLALVFFLMGGLGGGDVKFLAAVGAFLGPVDLWLALFVMAMVGGVMATFVVLRHGAARQTMANLHTILSSLGPQSFTGWRGPDHGSPVTLETPGVLTVPYGVAIAAGAMAGWLL